MFEAIGSEVIRMFSNLRSNLEKYSYTNLFASKKNGIAEDSASSVITDNNGRTKHAVCKHGGNLTNVTEETMRKVKVLLVNKPSTHIPRIDTILITLKRRLENPDQLIIHREGKFPIFNRTDIDVNNEEYIEEKIELRYQDQVSKDRKYKRYYFASSCEDTERIIRYTKTITSSTKEEQREVYRFKRDTDKDASLRGRDKSVNLSTSTSRQKKSNHKRSCSEEKYMRSPKNQKTACDDGQCSCCKTLKYKRYRHSSQFKINEESKKSVMRRHSRSSSHEKSNNSRRDMRSQSPYFRQSSVTPKNKKSFPSRKQRRYSSPNNIENNCNQGEQRYSSPSKYANEYGTHSYNFENHGAEGFWMPEPQFMPRNISAPFTPMSGYPYYAAGSHMQIPSEQLPFQNRMSSEWRSTTNPVNSSTNTQNVVEEPSSTSNNNDL